jgi:hypothetical protein
MKTVTKLPQKLPIFTKIRKCGIITLVKVKSFAKYFCKEAVAYDK